MRPIRSLLFVLLVVALGWLAGSALAQEGEQATPTTLPGHTIYLVRHGEKGTQDPRDPALSEAGEQRARELARVLGEAGVTHLFSTDYKRTRQTLEPLAQALGLSLQSYDPRAMGALVQELRGLPPASVAVVAGHSNTTPGLFHELSGQKASGLQDSPHGAVLAEESYDRLYSVTLATCEEEVRTLTAVELRYGEPSL